MARSELGTRPPEAGAAGLNELHFKDAVLNQLSEVANVAQFVSFSPGRRPELRYGRIRGLASVPHSLPDAINALIERSADHSVNVRSFDPAQPKANPFKYGLTTLNRVLYWVRRLAAQGLYTIVNETIDVNDGGISGVSYGGILEFGPGDTPRIVEREGTASLPREMGLRILSTVYGFTPDLHFPSDVRVEFSIHPLRRGVRHSHTVIWELEKNSDVELKAGLVWPNLFSRHVGDKTFGLLVGDAIGLDVPETTVVCRNVPPFRFGKRTGTNERWFRTSPAVQAPGQFTTRRGWIDPFKVMLKEDRKGQFIASVLDQEGVDARYSGAAIAGPNGTLTIEGVAGYGAGFMQGEVAPQQLPDPVVTKVTAVFNAAIQHLGSVRFEWVMDDRRVWIVQLHRGATSTSGGTIYPGTPSLEHHFAIERGLEALRKLINELPPGQNHGVVLVGNVGVTSHFGDLLRRARIPSRVETPRSDQNR